jgi:hypothetical protein
MKRVLKQIAVLERKQSRFKIVVANKNKGK